MTKFEDMSYEDLLVMQKNIGRTLAKRNEAKIVDVTVTKTARVAWHSPGYYNTLSVQDVIDSLQKIEDKTVPISFRESIEDNDGRTETRWGMVNKLLSVTVDEDAVANGESIYDCNQLVIDISEM